MGTMRRSEIGLQRLVELLAEDRPLPDVLNTLCEFVETSTPGVVCAILLLGEDGRCLRVGAAPSLQDAFCGGSKQPEIELGATPFASVVQLGQEALVEDTAADPAWASFRDVALHHDLAACAAVPIFGSARRVLGVFALFHRVPGPFPESELSFLKPMVGLASLAVLVLSRQAELRESQGRFTALLKHSSDLISLTDAEGHFLYVSPSFENALGHPPQDLRGRNSTDFIPPEDIPCVLEHVSELMDRLCDVVMTRHRVICRDGSIRWLETNSQAILDGTIPGAYVTNSRDITEQVRLEEELHISEGRLRSFVDALPDMYIRTGADGTVLDFKANSLPVFFWDHDVIGRRVQETPLPEHLKRLLLELPLKALETGAIQTAEYRLDSPEGELIRELRVVKSGEDETLSLIRDITKRKQSEEALKQSQLLLEEAQRIARLGSWEWDLQSNQVTWSDELFRLFDMDPGQPAPRPIDLVRLYEAGDFAIFLAGVQRCVDQGVPFDLDLRTTLPRGQIIHAQGKAVRDASGRVVKLMGTAMDITDRKRAEEHARRAHMLESLSLLAAGLAHDFNNLLATIQGNLELARIHIDPQTPLSRYMESIQGAVQRAADLAKQMLAFSGHGSTVPQVLDLNHQIEAIRSGLSKVVSPMPEVHYHLTPDLPRILMDPNQLYQVIHGLVTNACEAIGPGGGSLTLTTGRRDLGEEEIARLFPGSELRPGTYVTFEAKDTGCGMAAEVMSRIFDPFFTTKFLGRGLGLTAARGILRTHGGDIHVQSEPRKGSTFTVFLPARRSYADLSAPTPAPVQAPAGNAILFVDDEITLRESVSELLETLGYEVIQAVDGLDGVEKFKAHRSRIALVLMDLTMPRMDGHEAFEAMKDIDPSIPVVLSSGYTEQDISRHKPGQGPASFLPKPYKFKDLEILLEQILGPSPARSST